MLVALHLACYFQAIAMTLAIILPNTTYLPTDFAYDSIRTIIEGLGFMYESYEVVTEDGYILNLNRLINPDRKDTTNKGVPLLLVNGLAGHSDSWFLQADPILNAPVYWSLAGYDVWLGDQRGTVRSVKHKTLSTWSWEFWNFSFHESGYYDMPAFIDLILQETGYEKLAYSGLSDGGAIYYVFTTTRPEYQDKLYGGILWSPVGQSPPIGSMTPETQGVVRTAYLILHTCWDLSVWPYLTAMMVEDIPFMNQNFRKMLYQTCKRLPPKILKMLLYDDKGCQMEKQEKLCLQVATAVGGTSAKTILHTIQLFKDGGKFEQYNYGEQLNLQHYGQPTPPVYNISKLRVFTALYYSNIDNFAPDRTVVPFAHQFGGPAYECEIDNVCHTFVIFDHRVRPFLEDARRVLDEITGEAAVKYPFSTEMYKLNTIRSSRKIMSSDRVLGNPIYKCQVNGHIYV